MFHKFLLSAVLCFCAFGFIDCAKQNVTRVGNEILGSRSGVDVVGSIFLIRDGMLPRGVLYAVRAFFRSDSKVRFQVWRPDTNSNSSQPYFRLVGDISYQPSTVNRVEDVYLESVNPFSDECVTIEDGDQLGIYMEETPGSVAYAFDSTDPRALGYMLENTSVPLQNNDTVLFDSLTFPYDFSVAAFVHTDMDQYDTTSVKTKCPKGLLIPDDEFVTPPPSERPTPPTGAPGPVGPQGPRGATGPQGPNGTQGDLGNTGPQGYTGSQGVAGPIGHTGATGPMGSIGGPGFTGAIGPKGDKGERGPQGIPGPMGTPKSKPNAQAVSMFDDPNLVMGLLIWLIIVTILIVLLIILILFIVIQRRREKPKKEIKVSSLDENDTKGIKNGNSRLSVHSMARPEWMSTMKDESFQDVKNSTIDRRDGKIDHQYDNSVFQNDVNNDVTNQYDNVTTNQNDNLLKQGDVAIDIPDEPKSPNGSVAKEELTNY